MARPPYPGAVHPLAARALAGLLALVPACAAHGTRDDVEAVRAVLATRSELELVDLDPDPGERPGDAVARLLAEPLDADRAVRVAIANNRSLRAALAELGIARGELVQAGLLPNPVIDGEMRFPEDQEGPVQADVGIELDLTGMVLAPLRTELASARLEVARLRLAGTVLDLGYRTRIAFLRYQAAEQRAALVRAATEALEASVAAATALRDAGNYRDLDVAIEEAAFEEARVDVARAELDALDARQEVELWLGIAGSGLEWALASPLPEPSAEPELPEVEELEQRAIEASLELAEVRAEVDALGRAVGLARTEGLLPDIMVGFHAELDGDRWEYGPEAAIALPIFSQGQGRVIAREAELDAARQRYVGLAVAVRAAVRAARYRAGTTEALARRYRDVLIPARARVFELTLEQYNAMQIDVFRLLDARRDQIETEMRYVDVLREHGEARATLAQVLAGRLAGTLGRGGLEDPGEGAERARRATRRGEEAL